LTAIDLVSEKVLWEKSYEGGCDRMAMSPDGKTIYVPSLESNHWNVIDAETGELIHKIVTNSGAHNTIYGSDGKEVYMAGLKSPYLFVSSTKDHSIVRKIGPFGAPIRPFTLDGSQSRCYVNVNELLGFEIGDLNTGKVLAKVTVEGFQEVGQPKRHGCPSHGVALTPDEKELWLTDATNYRMHVFDNTVMPPKQIASIKVRDQPGWITFGIDGRYAYPSTGDIIETKTRKIIGGLTDETGRAVQSEKLLEIDFQAQRVARAGNQFGLGQLAKH
jgi:DNA-binding beta-propeller fold protein YncE